MFDVIVAGESIGTVASMAVVEERVLFDLGAGCPCCAPMRAHFGYWLFEEDAAGHAFMRDVVDDDPAGDSALHGYEVARRECLTVEDAVKYVAYAYDKHVSDVEIVEVA